MEVFLITILLCPRSLRETAVIQLQFTGNSCFLQSMAFSYKAPPAVSEWIYLHSACVQFLSGQKQTEFACPAVNFDRLMKNKLMDSTHLNNSDKLSRIIYGADKIYIIIY